MNSRWIRSMSVCSGLFRLLLPGHGHFVVGPGASRRQNGSGLGVEDNPELHLYLVWWVARRVTDGTQLPHQTRCHGLGLLQGVLEGGLGTLYYSRSRQAAPSLTRKAYVFYLD